MPWVPELIFRAQDLATLTQMYRGPKNDVDTYPDEVIEAYKYYFSQDGELWCVCVFMHHEENGKESVSSSIWKNNTGVTN